MWFEARQQDCLAWADWSIKGRVWHHCHYEYFIELWKLETENIRAVISHPSSCWCRSGPSRKFSCTLPAFVLNVQSHKPSSSAYGSSTDHSLISRRHSSVKCPSFSVTKWCAVADMTATFPALFFVLVLGFVFFFPCNFGTLYFCFLNPYEVSWGRRLKEDLATLAKVQSFSLDRIK